MLRFIDLILSNPERSDIPEMKFRAVVTSDDFDIAISLDISHQLGFESQSLCDVINARDMSLSQMWRTNPVLVAAAGQEATVQAIRGGTGITVGRLLAAKLKLAYDPGMVSSTDLLSLQAIEKNLPPDSPSNILIKYNAVSPETCKKICDYAAGEERKRIGESYRDTMFVYTDKIKPLIDELFYGLFERHIDPFFGVEVDQWEKPQLFIYTPGGHYDPHIDGVKWVGDGKGRGQGIWTRFLNRDISVLLYLNEDFTGGMLNFPAYQMRLKPAPGLLVAFPSSEKFRHGAEPTESGERLVLVSWGGIKGAPRTPEPPDWFIYKKDVQPSEKDLL